MGEVLIVGDDPSIRKLLSAMLRHIGYRVVEAPTTCDATRLVRDARIGSVLLDLRLDVSIDLVQLWRRLHIDVPVIALTQLRERCVREAALSAGADRVAFKPVTLNDLARHLNGALRRRRVAATAPPAHDPR